MKEKKMYYTPAIEVLNARVEKGFAGSPQEDQPDPDPISGFNAGGETGWSTGNTDDWWT